jgi:hypothetical protein
LTWSFSIFKIFFGSFFSEFSHFLSDFGHFSTIFGHFSAISYAKNRFPAVFRPKNPSKSRNFPLLEPQFPQQRPGILFGIAGIAAPAVRIPGKMAENRGKMGEKSMKIGRKMAKIDVFEVKMGDFEVKMGENRRF